MVTVISTSETTSRLNPATVSSSSNSCIARCVRPDSPPRTISASVVVRVITPKPPTWINTSTTHWPNLLK